MSAQILYWVDIDGQTYYHFSPVAGELRKVEVGLEVNALAARASGGLVMTTPRGFALWDEQTAALTVLALPPTEPAATRLNDGAVDSAGRFWAGTMRVGSEGDPARGNLYRLEGDHTVTRMDSGFIASNGIGWSPDAKTMYFTDSRRQVIYAYDYDVLTGAIEHRRPLIQLSDEGSVPDGLTVDSEGGIWSGWRIVRYDPEGKQEREIALPVQYPTSCAFGGPALDELYITSAITWLSAQERADQPLAGDVFRLKLGIKGQDFPRFLG
jgi:sugar lactone lactonase YvrE